MVLPPQPRHLLRSYLPLNTEEIYNDNADKWLRLTPSSLSDFTARPLVFEACGELNARSVLDIGCGEGYCARELKRRGAGDYLGVDLSEQMVKAAQAQEAKDQYGIEYRACNVVEFNPDMPPPPMHVQFGRVFLEMQYCPVSACTTPSEEFGSLLNKVNIRRYIKHIRSQSRRFTFPLPRR